MVRLRVVAVVILLGLMGIAALQAQNAPDLIAPNVFVRGIQLAKQVRYTATIIKPSDDATMQNISVEITLPADARLSEMLVARQVQYDVVRRNAQGQLTLIWQMSRLAADQPLDVFAFTTAEPLTSELEFYVQWQQEDGTPVVENFRELPQIVLSNVSEAQITLTTGDFAPIGATGIQIKATTLPLALTARLLPADFNPPPEYGDLWWCSLLDIAGLPANTSVEVLVPLRRPIAPFTALALFQQQSDGSWQALAGQAIVTADGQYVMYVHPGGVIATGGPEAIQPEIVPAEQITVVEESAPPVEAPVEPPAGSENSAPVEVSNPESPAENVPPADVGSLTDGTSNTIIVAENLPPADVGSVTDGTSNTIIVAENPTAIPPAPENTHNVVVENPPAQPTAYYTVQPTSADADVSAGNSSGERPTTSPKQNPGQVISISIASPTPPPVVSPLPTLASISDGSSNTIIIGERTTPFPTQANFTDGTSNTIIIGENAGTPLPTQASISDGSSNTIIIGERMTPFPTQSTITDGSSNTILIGESTITPLPSPTTSPKLSGSVIIVVANPTTAPTSTLLPTLATFNDGTSNTIIIGERTTPFPTQANFTDGTSNTIIIGENAGTPLPTQASISDGSSNTIIIGERMTPFPTQSTITDGSSNTILIGESTITPLPSPTTSPKLSGSVIIVVANPTALPTNPPTPTLARITDGSSNTILVGELTSTPRPIASATRIPPTTTPGPPAPTAIPTAVFPPPFGTGGARVEIVLRSGTTTVTQCQVGRVNCLVLNRTTGSRK